MLNPQRNILHSWKEIAAYIGMGVRTVQRYERTLGLPIRRFAGDNGSSVSAFPDELDHWMHTAGSQPIERAEWEKAVKDIDELRSEIAHLRKITDELNKRVNSNAVSDRSRKPSMENRSELTSAS